MITRILISALEKANAPGLLRVIGRGLETVTGVRTGSLLGSGLQGKSITELLTFSPESYVRHGFYGIAGALGAGYSSFSGISVTPDRALESAAVLACVRILSEDVGRLPMFLYRRTPDGVEKAVEHPLFGLLHDLPNPDMNASAFFEALTAQAVLSREGYAQIDRDSKGQPMYLWPMTNGPVTRKKNANGRPIFVYKDGNSAEKTFEADQVFNLPGFSLNGLTGDDIVSRMRHVLGLTLATQQYAGSFFANDATAGTVLSRPAGSGEPWNDEIIAAIKKKWREWHQGLLRAHEPAVLQDGVTATRLDPDHTKLQLVEQRKFQVIEVCRFFRMSPHMLADLDRATFSNIEQLYNQHLVLTLGPWLRRWKQSVYRCLLNDTERTTLYAEHSVEDFQRGLFLDQAKGFALLLDKGVWSINEVRRWFNMNPVAGGDEHYVQLNMRAVSDSAKAIVAEQDEPDLKRIPVSALQKLLPESVRLIQ